MGRGNSGNARFGMAQKTPKQKLMILTIQQLNQLPGSALMFPSHSLIEYSKSPSLIANESSTPVD
jgi:hypothetical protein